MERSRIVVLVIVSVFILCACDRFLASPTRESIDPTRLVVFKATMNAIVTTRERPTATSTQTPMYTPTRIETLVLPTVEATTAAFVPSHTLILTATSTEMPVYTPTRTVTFPSRTPTLAATSPETLVPNPSLTATLVPVAVIASEALQLRAGPGIGYARLGVYKRGTSLEVLGKSPGEKWLKVRVQDSSGKEGWVSLRYLDLNLDLLPNIPVAKVPRATPRPTEQPTPTATATTLPTHTSPPPAIATAKPAPPTPRPTKPKA